MIGGHIHKTIKTGFDDVPYAMLNRTTHGPGGYEEVIFSAASGATSPCLGSIGNANAMPEVSVWIRVRCSTACIHEMHRCAAEPFLSFDLCLHL